MSEPAQSLLTVGHSTHPWTEFVDLLKHHGVRHLADVRLMPQSRRHPWFGREQMGPALAAEGIIYTHFPGLGGLRKPAKDSPNGGWRNLHFRGYADYMATPEFQGALEELNRLLPMGPVAVMCSEAVPWRCHRSLLADAETARGIPVAHILGAAPPKPHGLTPFAVVEGDGRPPLLRYPPAKAPDPDQSSLLRDPVQTTLL